MPSTVVSSYYYIADSSTLRIVFTSGMVYDYLGVPENVFNEMKQAFSKGIFFNERIKGVYEFRKVER